MRFLLPALLTLCAGCEGTFEFEWPWVLGVAVLLVVATAIKMWRTPMAALAYTRVDDVKKLPMTARSLAVRLPNILRLAAIAAIAAACARPQLEEFNDRDVEGIDIFLVLDMSGSMAGVDMTPNAIRQYQSSTSEDPPNRFDNAIATLKGFVRGRERDRIGMVVFAREAYLQFPLTLDYSTIQTLLDRLELHAIDPSATAIGNALGLGIRGLLDSEATSRAIILITDGKQQGGNISPVQAAETADGEGILIYSILVGKEGPTMAPTNLRNQNGTSRYSQQAFAVDPALLQRVAEQTGGSFYRATQPEELEQGLNAILDDLERTSMSDVASVLEQELFAQFVLVGLALMLAEALLSWLLVRRFP
ncbi:MAG: Ca-activated chloride channel family protein [Bradymonadia bacterium]|jgi:Ca-activated chloride channel family protein